VVSDEDVFCGLVVFRVVGQPHCALILCLRTGQYTRILWSIVRYRAVSC
jgi:hypothetical protein